MKRAALSVCLVLGCSAPPTPDAGGTGGGGGGGGNSDAGYQFITTSDGLVTLAVPAGLDASTYSVSRIGTGVTLPADGGPVVLLGPDGAEFSPPAGVLVQHQVNQSDGGFPVHFWFIESADGRRESVEALTRFKVDDDGPAIAWTAMAVPHFTRGWVARGTTRLIVSVQPQQRRVFLVGEPITFRMESSDYESYLAGTLTLRTLPGPLLAMSNSVPITTMYTNQARLTTLCLRPGLATVEGEAFFSAYAESELDGGVKQPQTVLIQRNVLCALPPSPANPQVMLDPGDMGPPQNGHATFEIILQLLDLYRPGREVDLDFLTAKFDAQCGLYGKEPCKQNQLHRGILTVESSSPVPVNVLGRMRAKGVVAFGVGGAEESHAFVTTLSPPQTRTEPFLFVCLGEGFADLEATLSAQRPMDFLSSSASKFLGALECGGKGDAVMLSDNTRLTRTGNTWNAAATGVTANLISATDSIAPNFGALSESAVGLDGIAQFTGRVGLPRFRFQSARQNATWTHTGNGYTQSGLVGGAAYNASDSLTVTGLLADGGVAQLPDGGNAVVVLSAPPALPAPAQMFGPRSGLTTLMRLPDGTFDVLYVAITAPSPLGGTGGVFRTVRAADMSLDAGIRETPLLDNPSIQALTAWGIDAGTVYIAAYRQRETEGFFTDTDGGARSVPVQAGRMIQVSVPDLFP